MIKPTFTSGFHETELLKQLIVYARRCLVGAITSREIREGWSLLTVETEEYSDSMSTNERGPFLVGSVVSLCQNIQDTFILPWLL